MHAGFNVECTEEMLDFDVSWEMKNLEHSALAVWKNMVALFHYIFLFTVDAATSIWGCALKSKGI